MTVGNVERPFCFVSTGEESSPGRKVAIWMGMGMGMKAVPQSVQRTATGAKERAQNRREAVQNHRACMRQLASKCYYNII